MEILTVVLLTLHVFLISEATPVTKNEAKLEEVEVVVGVEDSKVVEVDTRSAQQPAANIAGSLVKDVKQINLFLNIPDGCNSIYDQLIQQLTACREGTDRGHPRLDKGCLLKMDFKKYKNECAETNVFFPTVGDTQWHPEPSCNGTYCEESSNLKFSSKGVKETNVAFPEEEDNVGYNRPPRKNKAIDDGDESLLVTLVDILNSKGKNGVRSELD